MNGAPCGGVHVLLPDSVDDPARPSGGNVYDRRLIDGLTALGWPVREHPAAGPDTLAAACARLPDGALALLDGLLAPMMPVDHARRLRLVVLLHMSFPGEEPVLRAARAVITTSDWSRREVLDRYGIEAHAAPPGVDPAPPTTPRPAGDRLLCVAAVVPHKGHDVLVDALRTLADLSWSCVCVGALDRDPEFAGRVTAAAPPGVRFVGPRVGADLRAAYAAADLLVVPSRAETYGMVVTEALVRTVPVLASDAAGLPETLGRAPDGSRPGLLVPAGDPAALAGALRRWLTDAGLRAEIRQSALLRTTTLTGWPVTAKLVSDVLSTVAPEESPSR